MPTRNPLQPRDTCRLKVKKRKKIFLAKGNEKKARVALYISEKKILIRKYYKSQRETLHSGQGINPRGKHKNCKYLCTQYRSTTIHKANTNRN